VRFHTALACALLITTPAVVAADTKAHRHGAARLQVSLDGQTLQITFDGPADNILGFERAPKTEAQKNTVAKAEQQLKEPAGLFVIPAEARCEPQPARVELKLPPPNSRDEHSEAEAEWRWRCEKPDALTHIDVTLFKLFPRLKTLRAEVATARGQRTVTLQAKAPRLKIGA
jgi:hypothetical protein